MKNNVFGTRLMAEAAHSSEAEHFILISSDKAVNPSSVMGVTKRVAELLILQMAQKSQTRFLAVRSRNVWAAMAASCRTFSPRSNRGDR